MSKNPLDLPLGLQNREAKRAGMSLDDWREKMAKPPAKPKAKAKAKAKAK